MSPNAPGIVGAGIAPPGLAHAELARQFQVLGRLLGNQGQRVEPGQFRGQVALTRAGLDLAQLERGFEFHLRLPVVALLADQGGTQPLGGGIVQPLQRARQPGRVAAQQKQVGQRQAQHRRQWAGIGIEQRHRQVAGQGHVHTPEFGRLRHCAVEQFPAKLSRYALERGGVEAIENRRVQQAIPVTLTVLDRLGDALEFSLRQSAQQCQTQ